MDDPPKQVHKLAAYQRSLCDEETLHALDASARPSPARFYAVARGKSRWTVRERAAIDADPKLRAFELQMQEAVRLAKRRPTVISLQRVVASVPATQVLRAAALAACRESDPIRFLSTHGGDVLLFPPDENGLVTVRFFGEIPHPVGLMVGESPVDFIKPIDQCGYAYVLAEHIRPVFSDEAELKVRTE